ncbi:MAG TPA: hypothetical protein VND21_01390 [Planctomycetota bacterium]|nr:hypothetical protein [Planctomycetota bacterium]
MTAAVFLLSAALLAHEVCLLRVLSIAWYHHAAALVVAVALLGFGGAGTLLALRPRLVSRRALAVAIALHAALIPASLHAAAGVDFNVLEVGWKPAQWLRLLALEGIFLLPFLAGALGVSIALSLAAARPGPTYAANLLGSGAGALLAAPLLTLDAPEAVLGWVAVVAAGGAALLGGRWSIACAVAGALTAAALGGARIPMSPFKDLPATPGGEVLATRHAPLGRVDLVASEAFHDAPGLSLESDLLPPRQQGLFQDGHLVAVKDLGPSEYLDRTLGALPFAMLGRTRALVLGVGSDLARADLVVEAHEDLLDLSGAPGVVREPRAWLEAASEPRDLIVHHVGRGDPLAEAPLLTVEGLALALSRVGPDGALAVSAPRSTPPRPELRLLLTAERVTPHVVAAASMDRVCVLLRHRALDAEETRRLHAFCDRFGFDVLRPDTERPERPRHVTDTPLVRPGPDYPYDVEPTTDDRPYFHRYSRWSRLSDALDRRATPFVEWAFLVSVVGFLQVTGLGLLLLLGPLLLSRAARAPAPLFLALGLAYMLLEMAFLSRAMVTLGSPTLAAAAVIGGFLVGSGVGSLAAERLGAPLRRAALAAALLAVPGCALLPSDPLLVALVCAVVAFPMGMPFPCGLARLPRTSVPWALAVNGCASVAASAGAPLLGSTFGIPRVAAAAAVLYALVALLARGRRGPAPDGTPVPRDSAVPGTRGSATG